MLVACKRGKLKCNAKNWVYQSALISSKLYVMFILFFRRPIQSLILTVPSLNVFITFLVGSKASSRKLSFDLNNLRNIYTLSLSIKEELSKGKLKVKL